LFRRDEDPRHIARLRSILIKIVLVMVVMTVCFLVRVVMFLFRPITGLFFPAPVFYIFAYILPETLPAVVQMFVIISTSVSKKKAAQESRDNQRKSTLRDGVRGPFVSNEPLLDHSYQDEEDDSHASGSFNLNYSDMGSQVETGEVDAVDYSRMGVEEN
jgi:hypothetical protein